MRTLSATLPHYAGHATSVSPIDAGERRLSVSVVATTDEGTRAALAAARTLGAGLSPRVVLLVPHVVPHLQPLDHLTDAVRFTENRFRRLAEEAETDVTVQVCVCRPEVSNLEALLPRQATVLVGGSGRQWWHSREQRLARRLAKDGLRVLFIDSRQGWAPPHTDQRTQLAAPALPPRPDACAPRAGN